MRGLLLNVVILAFVLTPQTWVDTTSSHSLIAKLECPDRVNDVAFSPDGKLLAAGYGWNVEGGVKVWDIAKQTIVATLVRGKDSDIERVAFSGDGKLLAASNSKGDVSLWAVGSWQRLKTAIFRGGSPSSLTFSSDGAKLAFSSNIAVILYDLKSGREQKIAHRANLADYFGGISFSPDGKTLAVCGRDVIWFWDIGMAKATNQWRSRGSVFSCRFSPSGKFLVAGGGPVYGEKLVVVREAATGEVLHELSDFRSGLFALAISHSEKLFALGGGSYGPGGDLSLWSLEKAQEVAYRSFGRFPIEGLAFSPDDTLLAAASADGYVALYAVDVLRGPQRTKQVQPLCGEILIEHNGTYIVPLSRVPAPMAGDFDYAYGSLAELGLDLESVKARLIHQGFVSIPREPVTRGLDHYRTLFIELSINGVRHLRSNAEVIDLRRGHPTETKKDFTKIFREEEPFISSILHAGKKLPSH